MLTLFLSSVAALGNSDYLLLRDALSQYVTSDNIPALVRTSFHDLINYDPFRAQGGPHGCIAKQPIASFGENNGLSEEVTKLSAFVASKFPASNFTFGDVVSLAGKVAVETAYPCVRIRWRFGRSSCSSTAEQASGPSPTITSYAEYMPFLNRYGFSAFEWAILTAGSHGIAGAEAELENTGFGDRLLSDFSSGKDWVLKTLYGHWAIETTKAGRQQYVNQNGLLRFPSDMAFFPSVLDSTGSAGDKRFADIQTQLGNLAGQPRNAFDQQFAHVYAKMLEIGTSKDSLTDFIETQRHGECPEPASSSTLKTASPTNTGSVASAGPTNTCAPPPPPYGLASSADRVSMWVACSVGLLLLLL